MALAKSSAKDQVAWSLVRFIREGKFKAGERIPAERTLIEQFKVSRSVVREALAILKTHGLIQSNFGCRPTVSARCDFLQINLDSGTDFNLNFVSFDAYQIFETRILIESSLARIAANQATKPDIIKMKDSLMRNKRSIIRPFDFYETDVQFHALLYEIPKNPILPYIHINFVNWLSNYWRLMPKDIEINRANYMDHKNILEAIIDRDPDGAESSTRDHLMSAWQYVKSVF